MAIITATAARKNLPKLINAVRYTNRPVVIGRHNKAEVMLIKFPEHMNESLSESTNINQYGGAFDFLEDEPDLYSIDDLTVSYV